MLYSFGSIVTWDQLAGSIEETLDTTVHRSIQMLKTDIQEDWPVDTGRSKAGWRVEEINSGWAVANNVKASQTTPSSSSLAPALPSHLGGDDSYVPTLWNGRQGPGVGSLQLPLGGDPIYQRWLEQTLKTNLENMKI